MSPTAVTRTGFASFAGGAGAGAGRRAPSRSRRRRRPGACAVASLEEPVTLTIATAATTASTAMTTPASHAPAPDGATPLFRAPRRARGS